MTYYISTRPYRLARRWFDQNGMEPIPDFTLAVDVREEEAAYILNALVPGLKAEDLNVQILDDMVTIQGEFKGDGSDYMLHELPHGSFKRTLRMPVSLDTSKTEADITDGILTLRLMKAESAKPRVIKVAAK